MADDFEQRLDSQLDKVIEAAIDAWLYQEGFHEGSCSEGEFRDTVNLMPEGVDSGVFNPVDLIVTYPEGKWYVDNTGQRVPYEQTSWGRDGFPLPFDARASIYNRCSGEIHAAFSAWDSLPDPAEFAVHIETLRSIATSLNSGGAFVDGDGAESQIDGGNLTLNDYIGYIDDELAQYNGAMIDSFDANYASRIRPMLNGQHVATCVLGTIMTGEQEIMKRAREDVMTLAVEAEKAFKALRERRNADWKGVFKAIGVVAAAAGLFLSAGTAATAIGAVGTVSGIIEGFIPEATERPEATLAGGTPEELFGSINDALTSLNKVISDQEWSFHWCGFRASYFFRSNREYFDIATPTDFLENDNGEYFAAGENIAVLTPHLRQIAARFNLIAGIQRTASTQLDSTDGVSPWMRWSTIGRDSEGHYRGWKDLYDELDTALSGSVTEMTDVAERMVLVSYDFEATDEQIAETLRSTGAQVLREQPDYN